MKLFLEATDGDVGDSRTSLVFGEQSMWSVQ